MACLEMAYRQRFGSLVLSGLPAVFNRCPSKVSESQPVLLFSRHNSSKVRKKYIIRKVAPSNTEAIRRQNERADEKEGKYRRLVLPDVNPYTLIASQLVAKESGRFASADSDDAVVQRVKEYINVHKEQLEPVRTLLASGLARKQLQGVCEQLSVLQAVDTVDEVVRRAVVRATDLWQPKKRSHLELLLREVAIDGGRKPKNLPAAHLPVRLKYALDGCRYAIYCRTRFNASYIRSICVMR